MMIGTFDLARISRQTSMPDTLGQHHVEQHEIGLDGVEQVERLRRRRGRPARGTLRGEADGEGVDEAVLVFDDEAPMDRWDLPWSG